MKTVGSENELLGGFILTPGNPKVKPDDKIAGRTKIVLPAPGRGAEIQDSISLVEKTMFIRFCRFLIIAILVLSCLPVGSVLAQGQYYPYGPPPSHDDYERERRREEREMRREERERQKWQAREDARRAWEDEEWRRHHERYFGGTVIQPRPYESPEAYAARVRNQCNIRWSQRVTYCNSIRDPHQRAACIANSNNELYECQSRF